MTMAGWASPSGICSTTSPPPAGAGQSRFAPRACRARGRLPTGCWLEAALSSRRPRCLWAPCPHTRASQRGHLTSSKGTAELACWQGAASCHGTPPRERRPTRHLCGTLSLLLPTLRGPGQQETDEARLRTHHRKVLETIPQSSPR